MENAIEVCNLEIKKSRPNWLSVTFALSFVLVEVWLGLLPAPYGAYEIIFSVYSKSFTTKTIDKLLLH